MAAEERPLVALFSCSQLRRPLGQAGLATVTFKTVERLTKQVTKVQARACVVHSDALSRHDLGRFVKRLRRELPFTDVVIWAPRGGAALVREALTAGARDVVLAVGPERVVATVTSIVEEQKILPRLRRTDRKGRHKWRFEGLISRSPKMWDIFDVCVHTAATDATVLILGETGTGKEMVARAIHRRSGRKGRFVALNCGAVPETLVDSELFGHVKGAFTSATRDKRGLFRSAQDGTMFLDEIGNIPLVAQYRLLRALQEDAVRPVGGDREIPMDVRVVAATSSVLEEAVVDGTFREDLLYRLDVIRIVIPPLRDRPEDVVMLFEYFSRRLARQYEIQRPELTEGFLDALQGYGWPGNVRQLENYAERLLLTQRRGPLTAEHFRRLVQPYDARTPGSTPPPSRTAGAEQPPEIDLRDPLTDVVDAAVQRVEKAYIQGCLQRCEGRVGDAASRAGISRRTLLRKLKAYDIDKRAYQVRHGS